MLSAHEIQRKTVLMFHSIDCILLFTNANESIWLAPVLFTSRLLKGWCCEKIIKILTLNFYYECFFLDPIAGNFGHFVMISAENLVIYSEKCLQAVYLSEISDRRQMKALVRRIIYFGYIIWKMRCSWDFLLKL